MRTRPEHRFLVRASGLIAWALACVADPSSGTADAEKGAGVVAALRAKGAEVLPLGALGGLDGYMVTLTDGEVYSLYVTADGHAVAGLLYGPDGALITGGQLTAVAGMAAGRLVDQTKPAPVGKASDFVADGGGRYRRALDAFGFMIAARGGGADHAPLAVIFADPACPFSRSAVARLGAEALTGRLRLKVVPVALLGAEAARRAAGIVSGPDPALAWFAETPPAMTAVGRARIADNNQAYAVWEESAVPLVVWRAAAGGISRRVGDIADLEAWLAKIGR